MSASMAAHVRRGAMRGRPRMKRAGGHARYARVLL